MFLADPLSRDCRNKDPVSEQEELHVQVILSITESELKRLLTETEKDETCQTLSKCIKKGWPTERAQVDKRAIEYWNFRDQLAEYDGIILNSHKTVIPKRMRKYVLKYVHSGHFGYEKCISRAKDYVY